MKVKLLTNICGPEGNFNIGDIAVLSETLANALVKDGHAKEIVEIKIEEVAVVEEIKEEIKQETPFKKTGGKK